jgi:hypothetical protein
MILGSKKVHRHTEMLRVKERKAFDRNKLFFKKINVSKRQNGQAHSIMG